MKAKLNLRKVIGSVLIKIDPVLSFADVAVFFFF